MKPAIVPSSAALQPSPIPPSSAMRYSTGPRWDRPRYNPSGRTARVVVASFFDTTSKPPLVVRPEHGLRVATLPPYVTIEHSPSVDDFRSGGFLGYATLQMAQAGLNALRRARSCALVEAELPDPPDLEHLQVMWALRRALAEAGSSCHLDVLAGLWDEGSRMAAVTVGSSLQMDHEILVFIEDEPSPELAGQYAAHTRGLVKFGRPDLMLSLGQVDAAARNRAAKDLRALALRLAEGEVIAPGALVLLQSGLLASTAVLREGVNAPPVGLANDGVLLSTVK